MKFKINDSTWENYPLWKYIKKEIPHYTKVLIIKELRIKNILVNETQSYFQYKLQLGDLITIKALKKQDNSLKIGKKAQMYTLTHSEKLSLKEQIIYENEHLFILNKKAGQSIQPDATRSLTSLQEKIQAFYLRLKGKKYPPRFVHRLDRSVSGLIIGAKTAYAHSLLSEALRRGEIEKKYQAIVYGSFPQRYLKLKNWILDQQKRVKVLTKEEKNSKLAVTEVKLLRNYKNFSHLEITLVTGRKNQIRAQLSFIGFPILGERKYLTRELKKEINLHQLDTQYFDQKKLALLSYKLHFSPHLVREFKLSSPSFMLPNNLNFLLNFLNLFNNISVDLSRKFR